MSVKTRWLSKLVMEMYAEQVKTESGSGIMHYFRSKFAVNVQLQTLWKELLEITDNIEEQYGTFEQVRFKHKDPFKEHNVDEKLFNLDLGRDDNVTFLQTLISAHGSPQAVSTLIKTFHASPSTMFSGTPTMRAGGIMAA